MAQPRSSGRGGAATKARVGNRTPNTPGISESKIYRMRVDEIRGQLRRRGMAGTAGQRKDDLVKSLIKMMKAEIRGGTAAVKKPAVKKAAAGRKPTAKKVAGAKPAAKKAAVKKTTAAARKRTTAAKKTTGAVRKRTTAAKKTTAPARKRTTAAKKTTAPARKRTTAAKKTTGTARRASATRRSATSRGSSGGRAGTPTSRSLQYAQRISSPDERPTRPGRSLVTSEPQVIRAWAQARDGQPSTIEGTERDGRPGVLTFDFPGFRSGGRLRPISWDDWFGTFDSRRLNFIYQEQKTNGTQSNFFRLESPDREDA